MCPAQCKYSQAAVPFTERTLRMSPMSCIQLSSASLLLSQPFDVVQSSRSENLHGMNHNELERRSMLPHGIWQVKQHFYNSRTLMMEYCQQNQMSVKHSV